MVAAAAALVNVVARAIEEAVTGIEAVVFFEDVDQPLLVEGFRLGSLGGLEGVLCGSEFPAEMIPLLVLRCEVSVDAEVVGGVSGGRRRVAHRVVDLDLLGVPGILHIQVFLGRGVVPLEDGVVREVVAVNLADYFAGLAAAVRLAWVLLLECGEGVVDLYPADLTNFFDPVLINLEIQLSLGDRRPTPAMAAQVMSLDLVGGG